jgi:3-methylfumaryl-CoA hydratase
VQQDSEGHAWDGWIGRQETAVDHITVPLVHRLAATLDRDDPVPRAGDPLPQGWHGVLFPRVVRQSQVGPDGHPERGDFVPPVPLPRRMNGGKRIRFHGELRVGDAVERISVIERIDEKSARSGRMIVVTVKTDIHSPRGLAVTEEQDILYRDHPHPDAPRPAPAQAPSEAAWRRTWTPDPVMLFRYSALMFNSHRIHYDAPYVIGTEGYPERIVNGGLSAMLVLELARQALQRPLTHVAVRNVAPMYVNQPLTVCGRPGVEGRAAAFWIANEPGELTLSADITAAS